MTRLDELQIIAFPLGVTELALILLIVIVIFGASKLPQLGRGLGEGISNFKTGLKGKDEPSRPADKKDGL
ncbi:MAG TPA: twin-arginine translocase TatA/TatE family subunit [Thermoanaerobaculia bacterium]|nr:twin-arginine translocase TatA/TatE family subunit [Thermoanaerobaculia bacterium]